MINRFKELKEILPKKGLDNVLNELEGKTTEEIKEHLKALDLEVSDEVAKACFDYFRGVEALEDDELENVAGGTCYSTDTFETLKITPKEGQMLSFHPAIVTSQNDCSYWENINDDVVCEICRFRAWVSGAMYCSIRSEEWDPYK